jgi:serine/threonine protein kinase
MPGPAVEFHPRRRALRFVGVARRKDRSIAATALPGYRDIVEIGGGAFATVYRAVEVDTGRPVALKILKVDAVHPDLVETFTQETQALAKVSNHPNIVTLYRPLVTADQRPVLVLELCQESLAQLIRRAGPLGARQVTRIGIKIAGALETAHLHGFLHLDMKPQNILVTQFGEPALSDFGVAGLQASAQAIAGVFGFTTLHAAPEILEGHRLSSATDIYGLASTMYQLLSGLPPFATFENEAPASVILRIIRDPVRPLRSNDIPIGLSDLLEAALSKDPDGRPRSAVEFAEGLVAIEASNDWPATAYVAWGDQGPVTPPTASRLRHPEPARGGIPARGGQSPSGPSLTVPDVALPRPTFPTMPSTPAAPAAAAFADPRWSAPPPPPPPPLARSGPSVSPPAAPDRNVVPPDQLRRGPQQDPAGLTPEAPLPPLRSPTGGGAEETGLLPVRPLFVDPDPHAGSEQPAKASGRSEARPRTVNEKVDPPPAALPAGHDHEDGESAPGRAQELPAFPLFVGAIALAALIIIASILVATGVL